ncbi:MAG: AfsA-related hotdog domain-containing protein [Bacilli bacterium]
MENVMEDTKCFNIEIIREIMSGNKKVIEYKNNIDFDDINTTHKILNENKIMTDNIIFNSNKISVSNNFTHKLDRKNSMICDYVIKNNILYVIAKTSWNELHSDHESGHMDGIKIFEAARQAMLFSQHFYGVEFGKEVLLTKSDINYKQIIEDDVEIILQVYTLTKGFGKSHTVFNIFQNNQLKADGYFITYIKH